jgi:predicted TIM-barrel fold metal-dependent hydrolase
MEIARAFNNVLLDLSFTINKYIGSSLDLDIKYLFESFDQRICIGSDFPQYSISEMRNRFNIFAENINAEKALNIAIKNLTNFLKF